MLIRPVEIVFVWALSAMYIAPNNRNVLVFISAKASSWICVVKAMCGYDVSAIIRYSCRVTIWTGRLAVVLVTRSIKSTQKHASK